MIDSGVVVTGSSGSLGKVLVNLLAAEYANVYCLDLAPPGDEIPTNAKFIECDLTDLAQTERVMETIFSESAKLAGLVNVAGWISNSMMVNALKRGEDRLHSVELWNKTIELNLSITFKTTLKFVDQMFKSRQKGAVVNVSSVSAAGNIGQSAYSAAKAGVEALTRVWSKEFAPMGIRCCCISPGFFNSESTHKSLSEGELKRIKDRIPGRQLGNPQAFAQAVRFSLQNDYYNGRVLQVDGGISL